MRDAIDTMKPLRALNAEGEKVYTTEQNGSASKNKSSVT